MPNETYRPQTFEEARTEYILSKGGKIPMHLNGWEAGWHARDAAFAQVEQQRNEMKVEIHCLNKAIVEARKCIEEVEKERDSWRRVAERLEREKIASPTSKG